MSQDSTADLIIAWDPAVLSPEQYIHLVKIFGDLVRLNGGAGIQRITPATRARPSGPRASALRPNQ